jgi:hypothetical protein
MDPSYLAFMEFFIVIALLIGWGVIELVGLRLDKRRADAEERVSKSQSASEIPEDKNQSGDR